MKELISELVSKADLSEAQASKVAEVVRNFIASKLPDALRGPVESALTGRTPTPKALTAGDVARDHQPRIGLTGVFVVGLRSPSRVPTLEATWPSRDVKNIRTREDEPGPWWLRR
jgi:hypothetical protein